MGGYLDFHGLSSCNFEVNGDKVTLSFDRRQNQTLSVNKLLKVFDDAIGQTTTDRQKEQLRNQLSIVKSQLHAQTGTQTGLSKIFSKIGPSQSLATKRIETIMDKLSPQLSQVERQGGIQSQKPTELDQIVELGGKIQSGQLKKLDRTQIALVQSMIDKDELGEDVLKVYIEAHAPNISEAMKMLEKMSACFTACGKTAHSQLDNCQGLTRSVGRMNERYLTATNKLKEFIRTNPELQDEFNTIERLLGEKRKDSFRKQVVEAAEQIMGTVLDLKSDLILNPEWTKARLARLEARLETLVGPALAPKIFSAFENEVSRLQTLRVGLSAKEATNFVQEKNNKMLSVVENGASQQDSAALNRVLKRENLLEEGFVELKEKGRLDAVRLDEARNLVGLVLEHPLVVQNLKNLRETVNAPKDSAITTRGTWEGELDRTIDFFVNNVSTMLDTLDKSTLGSLTGDSREIVTLADWQGINGLMAEGLRSGDKMDILVKKMQARFEPMAELTKERLSTTPAEINRLDEAAIAAMQASPNTLSKEQIQMVMEAKTALYDIYDQVTTTVSLDLLMHAEGVMSPEDQKKLQRIQALASINSLDIDDALLDRLISDHDQKGNSMNVGIEGAGPTGLLSAFTFFRDGMNIRLIEARSGEYSRGQILRIDPRWMNNLRFFLGTSFDDQFSKEGQGRIREGGYGQLITRNLEDALHLRLTQLISRLKNEDDIVRVAAHSVKSVLSPETEGGKFRIHTTYDAKYDAASKKKEGITPDLNRDFEVDLIVAAGGPSSALGAQFFPGTVPETATSHYGVASWTQPKGEKNDLRGHPLFSDHVRGLPLGNEFEGRFRRRVQEIQNSNTDVKMPILVNKSALKDVAVRDAEKPGQVYIDWGQKVKTRLFDNRDTIYIGMEVPDILQKILDNITGDDANAVKDAQKELVKAWFQTVAEAYGLDKLGLTVDKMEKNFTSIFPVQQQRVTDAMATVKKGSSELTVFPAGDLKGTPHFFSGSGITSARVGVELIRAHLQSLRDRAPDGVARDRITRAFETKSKALTDYIIGRGRPFLAQIPEQQVHAARRQAVEKSIAKLVDSTNKNIQKVKGDTMVLYEGKWHRVVVNENAKIDLQNEDTIKTFSSIHQVMMGCAPISSSNAVINLSTDSTYTSASNSLISYARETGGVVADVKLKGGNQAWYVEATIKGNNTNTKVIIRIADPNRTAGSLTILPQLNAQLETSFRSNRLSVVKAEFSSEPLAERGAPTVAAPISKNLSPKPKPLEKKPLPIPPSKTLPSPKRRLPSDPHL